jgi:hypothetical protein
MRSVVDRNVVMRLIPVIVALCHNNGMKNVKLKNVQLPCIVVIGVSWSCAGRLCARTAPLCLNACFEQGRAVLTNVY